MQNPKFLVQHVHELPIFDAHTKGEGSGLFLWPGTHGVYLSYTEASPVKGNLRHPCAKLCSSATLTIANPVGRAVPGQPVLLDAIIAKPATNAASALVLEGRIVAGEAFSTEAALVILPGQHFFQTALIFPVKQPHSI